MIPEVIMFILLFLLVGVCAGFVAMMVESTIHRQYEDKDDWPEDDDWTIMAGYQDEH